MGSALGNRIINLDRKQTEQEWPHLPSLYYVPGTQVSVLGLHTRPLPEGKLCMRKTSLGDTEERGLTGQPEVTLNPKIFEGTCLVGGGLQVSENDLSTLLPTERHPEPQGTPDLSRPLPSTGSGLVASVRPLVRGCWKTCPVSGISVMANMDSNDPQSILEHAWSQRWARGGARQGDRAQRVPGTPWLHVCLKNGCRHPGWRLA